MSKQYEEELRYEDRCLRTLTGKLLFGPNGNRLSVDCLDRIPGFSGSIDFIHKMNITELFKVLPDNGACFDQADSVWYPTRLTMEYAEEGFSFRETKTVTRDDCAVSFMEWKNIGDEPLALRFSCEPEGFLEYGVCGFLGETAEGKDLRQVPQKLYGAWAISPPSRFEFSLGIVCGWSCKQAVETVMPGETRKIAAVAAVGNLSQETMEALEKKVGRFLSLCLNQSDGQNRMPQDSQDIMLQKVMKQNQEFYEAAPSFLCDDKRMNACWKYRWYILKNCLSRPGYGRLNGAVMYEGRDHRMAKTPFAPSGWEFSKLVPLSSPLQLMDFRWHQDHKTVKEMIRSAFAGQDENGLLLCSYVDSAAKSYANFMLWAIWQYYLLDPDKEYIKELLPAMKAYIEGHEKTYTDGRDSLLIERTHSLTGKEYQPSYWYFHQFPQNPKDPAGFTPLKRVDRSVYHYLNLMGLSNLMEAVGAPDSGMYREKAQRLKQDINDKMWDSQTGFYYDLHYETGEKAMVKNIVGVYPYWAQIAGEERKEGIEKLLDKELFDTGSAFPSVAKDCPVFSPAGGWMGNYIKGRNGCIWCGPSWPYTTGIALCGLGEESLSQDHRFDQDFDRFFQEYTIQHFRDGDRRRPYLVEHYNPVTGERLSDEADYNHSFWIDLAVRYVAGVQVKPDTVKIDPLKTHLKWFRMENLPIRGRKVTVMYSEKKAREEIPCGLTVLVDGKVQAHREDLGALEIGI